MIKKEMLKKIFAPVEYGSVKVVTPEKEEFAFKGKKEGVNVTLSVNEWKALDAVALQHDSGFFEAYAENMWDTDSLENLCEFVFQNEKAFQKVDIGVVEGVLFWAQSSRVKFQPKKPLSDYELDLKHSLDDHPEERILLLGKNNKHLSHLSHVTVFQHGVEYEPFDRIIVYDPFFYVKSPDVFLKVMNGFLRKGGRMFWRTFVFQEKILTQGQFLSKLVFPGYWAPTDKELRKKIETYFTIENEKDVDYPKIDRNERLFKIFNAIIIALTKTNKLDYKEFELSPK
ncbi:MAG: hypothetical protein H6850_02680 [Alphaproteobacteria bacterium]|nr:MAG: hypothetical protein H6850_02680 [Alphaproteobacteria bacterium]